MEQLVLINNVKKKILEKQKELQKESIAKVYIRDVYKHIEQRTGVKWQNVDQIYKKCSNGSIEVALKLAKYFECSVEDLYSLENEENTNQAS